MGLFDVPPFTPARFSHDGSSWPVWLKPEATLPGVAVGERLLVHTDEVAVQLGSLWGYRNGFEAQWTILTRHAMPDRDGMDGSLAFLYHRARLTGQRPPDTVPHAFLRLGFRYADGRVAVNTDARPLPPPEVEPSHPIVWMTHAGGGGPMRRLDLRCWIWPLPPPGQLTLVYQWSAYGIPETEVDIDTGSLLDAASRSVTLWPEEPGEDELAFRSVSP